VNSGNTGITLHTLYRPACTRWETLGAQSQKREGAPSTTGEGPPYLAHGHGDAHPCCPRTPFKTRRPPTRPHAKRARAKPNTSQPILLHVSTARCTWARRVEQPCSRGEQGESSKLLLPTTLNEPRLTDNKEYGAHTNTPPALLLRSCCTYVLPMTKKATEAT